MSGADRDGIVHDAVLAFSVATSSSPSPPPSPPSPPPSPPSPPPPPPESSRTLDARFELVGFAGAFGAAAQAATASAVAEGIGEHASLSAGGANVTNVVVVSYGILARLRVVLRRPRVGDTTSAPSADGRDAPNAWPSLAAALAADVGASPASRVSAGVAAANASVALEISVGGCASADDGDSISSLAGDAAASGTSAFASRANEAGYAVVDSTAVGSVAAVTVRVALVTPTRSDASETAAALDVGASAIETGLRAAVETGSIAAKLRARGFDVDVSTGAYADRFAEDALFVGSEESPPDGSLDVAADASRGYSHAVLAAFACGATAAFL